jgi:hypothetical protein
VIGGGAPVWWGGRVPRPPFALPSGRLFFTRGGAVAFVLYDGKQCQLFRWDEGKRSLQPSQKLDEVRDELGNLWRTSFSLEDAYWSSALVLHAPFFVEGVPKNEFDGQVMNVPRLYAEWRKLKAVLEK